VVSERLGHATVAITLDVYSHVIPGMDAQAANAVARLILGDSSPNERPGLKSGPSTDRLTTTPSGCPFAKEVKRQTCWSVLVAGEGFEPSTSGL